LDAIEHQLFDAEKANEAFSAQFPSTGGQDCTNFRNFSGPTIDNLCTHLEHDIHHLYAASAILEFQLGVHSQNVASIITQDPKRCKVGGGMITVKPKAPVQPKAPVAVQPKAPVQPKLPGAYTAKQAYMRYYKQGFSPFLEDQGKRYDPSAPWPMSLDSGFELEPTPDSCQAASSAYNPTPAAPKQSAHPPPALLVQAFREKLLENAKASTRVIESWKSGCIKEASSELCF
jgi:hypothetical protein